MPAVSGNYSTVDQGKNAHWVRAVIVDTPPDKAIAHTVYAIVTVIAVALLALHYHLTLHYPDSVRGIELAPDALLAERHIVDAHIQPTGPNAWNYFPENHANQGRESDGNVMTYEHD